MDHYVPSFLWVDEVRDKISLTFEGPIEKLLDKFNSVDIRATIFVPGFRSNGTKVRKAFHFTHHPYNSGINDISHTKYVTHFVIQKVSVGPFKCVEYNSFANIIDNAEIQFEATSEV